CTSTASRSSRASPTRTPGTRRRRSRWTARRRSRSGGAACSPRRWPPGASRAASPSGSPPGPPSSDAGSTPAMAATTRGPASPRADELAALVDAAEVPGGGDGLGDVAGLAGAEEDLRSLLTLPGLLPEGTPEGFVDLVAGELESVLG